MVPPVRSGSGHVVRAGRVCAQELRLQTCSRPFLLGIGGPKIGTDVTPVGRIRTGKRRSEIFGSEPSVRPVYDVCLG
jgi:hypothetical protein